MQFLPYVASPAGCQALLLGKPLSPALLALEGGSELVQVPVIWSPSCAAGSLSPSHTADESAHPTGAHRHCNVTRKIFNSERQ